ncbi:hypothetical protein K8I85_02835, partial [bacterium]|nr:hypothetical protein [bacterium]
MGTWLRVSLFSALGYGLLEIAFFAERNLLLPWQAEHATLAFTFFLIHFATALVVTLPAALLLSRRAGALLPFVPIATLLAVHGVSFFRERFYALPRDLSGSLGSLAMVLLPFA